jgi:hypothetical protein
MLHNIRREKNGERKMDYDEWKTEYDEREFRRQTEISSLDDYPVCAKNRISVVKGALGEIFPHGDKRTMITGILNQPVYQKRGKHYWMKTDADSHGLEAVYCICSDCDMGLWIEKSAAEELPDIEEVWPGFNEY